MKRLIPFFFVILCLTLILTTCPKNLTNKRDIISLYQKHEDAFLQAVSTADYRTIEKINGVQKVVVQEAYIDIQCGASGMGPSTHYYGIFYSAADDLCAVDVAGPKDKLVEQSDGYFYQEENGDNRYYVESLGNHFYYYEAHF